MVSILHYMAVTVPGGQANLWKRYTSTSFFPSTYLAGWCSCASAPRGTVSLPNPSKCLSNMTVPSCRVVKEQSDYTLHMHLSSVVYVWLQALHTSCCSVCMHLSSVVYVWLKALHASCCCARVWCVSGVTMAPCMHLSSVVYVWFQALHTSCCSLWLTLWWCSSTSEWHSTASPPGVRASCVAMCGARCAGSAGHLEQHRASYNLCVQQGAG